MTRIGTVGTCAIVDRNEDIAYYVSLALIRPNHDIINNRYLKHIIHSSVGRRELAKRTLVNAVPLKINMGEIGKICIPLVSIQKQVEIADALDNCYICCISH